jgi:hypothetical protein
MTCDDVFDLLTRGPFPSGAAGDDQVEDHLTYCIECRRLAAALQPAIELFHESIGPEKSAQLPGYRGQFALPGPKGLCEHGEVLSGGHATGAESRSAWTEPQSVSRPQPVRGRARRALRAKIWGKSPASSFAMRVTKSRTNLSRFAAAVLLGVAAAAGTRALVAWRATSADFPDHPSPPVIARAANVGDDDAGKPELGVLAGLVLPAACRSRTVEPSGCPETAPAFPTGIQLASADTANGMACCTDCHNSGTVGLLPTAARSIVVGACTACH